VAEEEFKSSEETFVTTDMNSQYAKEIALGFLLLYGFERVLETFWRREKRNGHIKSEYSIYLLIVAYLVVYVVASWETLAMNQEEFKPWLALLGVCFVVLSIVGRILAIRALGPYHSIHVEIYEDHKLITAGPYRYVRNPYYSSVILEVIGLSLISNSFVTALVTTMVYLPVLVLRIVLEEKALAEKFNGSFADYARRIPQLLPKIR
jgi:protein-S-isoprenylcysteine O-methyltransferase Ste14